MAGYIGAATAQQDAGGPPGAGWQLVFEEQFDDSDNDLDVMWGDVGKIYFWVREQDAREHDFSGVWLILQCA